VSGHWDVVVFAAGSLLGAVLVRVTRAHRRSVRARELRARLEAVHARKAASRAQREG
jgi:hypothetical protein